MSYLPAITTPWYAAAITRWAKDLNSDGCTCAIDYPRYLLACYEHDCHRRTGKTLFGERITDQQAHNRFWAANCDLSWLPAGLRWADPVAARRWLAVSIFNRD